MVGAWLLATALMQLLARWGGGTGTFERLTAATALATAIGTAATMIPDLLTSLGIYDDLHGTWVAVAVLGYLTCQGLLLLLSCADPTEAAMRTAHFTGTAVEHAPVATASAGPFTSRRDRPHPHPATDDQARDHSPDRRPPS